MSAPTSTPAAPGAHNLGLLTEVHEQAVGDYDALFFEGVWHRSGDLADRTRRVAAGLQLHGVAPGDRVLVLMMNTPEVGITYQACWRMGAVVTPVLFLISPPELAHLVGDSGARVAVVSHELVPLLGSAGEDVLRGLTTYVVGPMPSPAPAGLDLRPFEELEASAPGALHPSADDDLAALLYTGGTTGRSKGVMLTHDGLWSSGQGLYESGKDGPVGRALLPLPLSHAYGLIVTITGLHATDQRIAVLQRWFDADQWLTLVAEHRIETCPVVPSMLAMLLAKPLEEHDLSSLQMFGSGGAPLPDAIREEVARRLPQVEIIEGYGLTESSAVVTANQHGSIRRGSVGRVLPHAEVAIVDPLGKEVPAGEDGEVCVRGPGVMAGYWKSPEATATTIIDGWLHTGDIGHLDDDGYLFIVDRLKDLVIRNGFNVYPRDVEEVFMAHPDVTAAACVGRPDPRVGEEVVVFVSLRPGSPTTTEELVEWGRARLAAPKYPRVVSIVAAVPLTSVGKTNRKAVRALLDEVPA